MQQMLGLGMNAIVREWFADLLNDIYHFPYKTKQFHVSQLSSRFSFLSVHSGELFVLLVALDAWPAKTSHGMMEQRKFIRYSYGCANGTSSNSPIHTIQLCNNKFYLLLLIFFVFLIKLCTFNIRLPTSYIPIPFHNIMYVHNLGKRIKKKCQLNMHFKILND